MSVFTGAYITGNVSQDYLSSLARKRSDAAKKVGGTHARARDPRPAQPVTALLAARADTRARGLVRHAGRDRR